MIPAGTQSFQFPLKVTLTAMSERMQALIEYYIAHNEDRFFAIADNLETADVVIVDHDHPDTATRIESGEWISNSALLVLAARHLQVTGAIIVRKPLDSLALEHAARTVLRRLNQESDELDRPETTNITRNAEGMPELVQPSSNDQPAPERTNTPAYFRTNDAALPGPPTLSTMKKIERYRAKIDLLCGPQRSLQDLRAPLDTDHRVDPARCLSQTIASIVFNPEPKLKAAQISLPDVDIFILPTLNKVYSSLSFEYRRNVKRVFKEWDDDDIKVHKYHKADVNNVIDTLNRSPRYGFTAHSFCWLSALFSTQGRLPIGFDIDSVCKLHHWPNITRLELIPYCLEIVAAWADRPATLSQIVDQVGCEPRHAVSLFNAACTIGVMSIEEKDDQ